MSRITHKRPSEAYEQLVGLIEIDRDPAQVEVLKHLDRLCDDLAALPSRKAGLGWLFGRKPLMPRGLYLWGSVGRGKTMLMDLMLESAPLQQKRRMHFQSFMADVHHRIHDYRMRIRQGDTKDSDPIPPVARTISDEITLLCLDEFSVTDIADAMILARLFKVLFENGLVLVTTSNIEPARLYEHGLNRALFLPFIKILTSFTVTVELDAPHDYRLDKAIGLQSYFSPDDETATHALNTRFEIMTQGVEIKSISLAVLGHEVIVPQSANGIARFHYADLFQKALGANDFIAIGEYFHTVFIDHVPIISSENHNEAKRFIALIDALYDRSVKLYITAAARPEFLYRAEEGREAFEFDRTVSRLIEMQSELYHALPHGLRAVGASLGGNEA
ncbi:MAG: cell division protein ZapE [Alphaproteobacteria bacterium]